MPCKITPVFSQTKNVFFHAYCALVDNEKSDKQNRSVYGYRCKNNQVETLGKSIWLKAQTNADKIIYTLTHIFYTHLYVRVCEFTLKQINPTNKISYVCLPLRKRKCLFNQYFITLRIFFFPRSQCNPRSISISFLILYCREKIHTYM